MGLILRKNVDDDCLLGIWEITENYDSLYTKIKLLPEEQTTLEGFQNYQRKLEWLSVRLLVNTILEKDCNIVYNEQHKPFLSDNTHSISISHSKNLTSVLLSAKKRVGIDLEYMSHQIHNVAHKFINYNEVLTNDPSQRRLHLYIHWCAKEAIYKICDKQDINFKENITVQPFRLNHEGELEGLLHNRHGNENFKLKYFLIDGYVVVWCNK